MLILSIALCKFKYIGKSVFFVYVNYYIEPQKVLYNHIKFTMTVKIVLSRLKNEA